MLPSVIPLSIHRDQSFDHPFLRSSVLGKTYHHQVCILLYLPHSIFYYTLHNVAFSLKFFETPFSLYLYLFILLSVYLFFPLSVYLCLSFTLSYFFSFHQLHPVILWRFRTQTPVIHCSILFLLSYQFHSYSLLQHIFFSVLFCFISRLIFLLLSSISIPPSSYPLSLSLFLFLFSIFSLHILFSSLSFPPPSIQ